MCTTTDILKLDKTIEAKFHSFTYCYITKMTKPMILKFRIKVFFVLYICNKKNIFHTWFVYLVLVVNEKFLEK